MDDIYIDNSKENLNSAQFNHDILSLRRELETFNANARLTLEKHQDFVLTDVWNVFESAKNTIDSILKRCLRGFYD